LTSANRAVDGVGYTAGASAFNTGSFFINLKPRAKRGASADQIIARLRPVGET
jgi:multidrug efflux pump subunit AcrB